MNKKELIRRIKSEAFTLAKQFDTKHTVKHALITMGLTAVGGPLGLAMGMTYCLGDTVDKSKKFTDKDFKEFLSSIPRDTRSRLLDMVKEK